MIKIGRLIFLLTAFICLTSPALAQVTPSDVHVKLVLAESKTTFRIGDEIKFFLEFTADREGYKAEILPDRSEPTNDALQVSPESGVYQWLKEIRARAMGRDMFSSQPLSANPTRVELVLNDSIRIDHPGKYSAKVTTSRVSLAGSRRDYSSPPIPLTTNDVTFDVTEMTDEEETEGVKRLADQLDATRDARVKQQIIQHFSFLTGDVSSREKVRRFLNGESMYYGLYIARNRALVWQLLEKAMRDPNTPVEPSLLSMLTSLRFLEQNSGLAKPVTISTFGPNADPRVVEIEQSYVRELAAGLGKRTGKAQTVTAMTVLTNLPKDPKAAAPLLVESRQIVLEQFENLPLDSAERLLAQYWNVLGDPLLIPGLKRLLISTARMGKGINWTVLKRLIELSPAEARPYVIAAISSPLPFINLEILGSLPDKTLPEVDQPLLSQLRAAAKMDNVSSEIFLKPKAAMAVRYATGSIYPDVMVVYTENVKQLTMSSRAVLLAYLAKQNEREALPLIEQALAELPANQEFNFLPELTKLYFSDGIAAILRKRVESDQPEVATTTAYLLATYGDAGDRKILEARLERWRKEWGARQLEADTNQQGRIEAELISGLNRAKDGRISPERVKELQQSCITKFCKQQFPTPQP
jgi:hypothetical protein